MKRLACALALAACETPPSSTANWPGATASVEAPAAASPACGKAAPKGVLPKHVTVLGKKRSYTLVVPASYSPGVSQPLVYVLHGHGGSGAQARASFDLEAASGGKGIFLYPDAGAGGWDLDSPTSKNADVALFDATLALTHSDYCIDLHRVFVVGFSNGAYMANQLACRRADRVRAIVAHSGGGPYENGADAKYDDHGELVCNGKPVAALVIHGTADGTVAPSEGQKSIDHWVLANHCSAPTGSPCATYSGCMNPVIACKVHGLQHTVWPEAAKRAWTFLDAQR